MTKQVPETKLEDYVKAYQDKYPEPKRGTKTPEGIAKAARNLVKKTTNKGKKEEKSNVEIRLDSLALDPNYSEQQANYFEKRFKQFIKQVPKNDPQFEGVVYFLVLQEIKLVEHFRILNSKSSTTSEINRAKKELDHGMSRYNKLIFQFHQLKTAHKRLQIEEGKYHLQYHKNVQHFPRFIQDRYLKEWQ